MRDPYQMLYQGGSAEIVEKKSRFIATLLPVKSEQEAVCFIEGIRKKHWDADHNCYGWVVGKNGNHKRCSDDGEPSQTAGRPMLEALEGICNVCAVVTRYFGGTLLGSGGLARAYYAAVQAGLKNSTILCAMPAVKMVVTIDYNDAGKIHHLFDQKGIAVLERQYTAQTAMTVLIPEEEREGILSELADLTRGRAGIEVQKEVYYGMHDKKAVLVSEE